MLNYVSEAISVSMDPLILSGAILMGLGIFVPCFFWFIRNFYRVVVKKHYDWMSKSLKILWIIGLAIFLLGGILLIIKISVG